MKWIKVEDQFPPPSEMVIGYQKDPELNIDIWDFIWYYGDYKGLEDWESYRGQIEKPTHWMPLPHPPELSN